jgi:type IV pilus assembly protein PilA
MIVVAIIGILAAIALPAYQDYTVRTKISEGLVLAGSAKTTVSEAYQSGGVTGLQAASTAWNTDFAANGKTKYVSAMATNTANGEITITYDTTANGISQLGAANVMCLTPYVTVAGAKVALSGGGSGSIDWGCSGAGNTTANNAGMPAIACAGSVAARYSPTQCK